MLLYFKLGAKEYKTQEENINRALYRGVFFDLVPGLFHFGAPMNVVEDKDGVVV